MAGHADERKVPARAVECGESHRGFKKAIADIWPTLGDRTFASAFNTRLAGKTLRYVNHHDIVTHVPPPILGHKHVDVARYTATGREV